MRVRVCDSHVKDQVEDVFDISEILLGICLKVCTGDARDEAACQEASCPVF